MPFLLHQFERLWYWVQQGGNSNIILVGITAAYSFLTLRMMQATNAQARAMAMPSVSLSILHAENEDFIYVKNTGSQSLVFLEVLLKCYTHRKDPKLLVDDQFGFINAVLAGGASSNIRYDFTAQRREHNIQMSDCSIIASITVSDLPRTVTARYSFPVTYGAVTCQLGKGWGYRFRCLGRELYWRRNRVTHRFLDLVGWLKSLDRR